MKHSTPHLAFAPPSTLICASRQPSTQRCRQDHANEPAAGVSNRVMEWASYVERIQGELYYLTTGNYKSPDAAWGEAKFYGELCR